MLRSIGKTCLACAYTVTHAARRFTRSATDTGTPPFIICYHRVVEDFNHSAKTSIPSMLISASMLDRHIEWLAKRFSIVSLDEIGTHLASGRGFRRPAAAITFDDGYSDVYHHAFPLLKRKGIPAAVFAVTGLVGTGKPQIFDRLFLLLRLLPSRGLALIPEVAASLRSLGIDTACLTALNPTGDEPFEVMTWLLNSLPGASIERMMTVLEQRIGFDGLMLEEFAPLDWDMIQTMHRNGITIGSHTDTHALLTAESLAAARQELIRSKKVLESKLRTAVSHFAYPDGRFNEPVVRAVHSTGYRFAYGICHRRDRHLPLLTIPRKVLWERSCLNAFGRFSSSIMNCHANGAFDPKHRCEHDHSTIREEETHGTIN